MPPVRGILSSRGRTPLNRLQAGRGNVGFLRIALSCQRFHRVLGTYETRTERRVLLMGQDWIVIANATHSGRDNEL